MSLPSASTTATAARSKMVVGWIPRIKTRQSGWMMTLGHTYTLQTGTLLFANIPPQGGRNSSNN